MTATSLVNTILSRLKPSEWDDDNNNSLPYRRIILLESSHEYRSIKQEFLSNSTYSHYVVTQIERIQHPIAFANYQILKLTNSSHFTTYQEAYTFIPVREDAIDIALKFNCDNRKNFSPHTFQANDNSYVIVMKGRKMHSSQSHDYDMYPVYLIKYQHGNGINQLEDCFRSLNLLQ